MKFRVIHQLTSHNAQSPVRVVEQTTGREVGWINRYLDREYVRLCLPKVLCSPRGVIPSAGSKTKTGLVSHTKGEILPMCARRSETVRTRISKAQGEAVPSLV